MLGVIKRGCAVAVVVALATTGWASAVVAQPTLHDEGGEAEVVERVTKYDFMDDAVEGKLMGPEELRTVAEEHERLGSLITVRMSFVDVMVKSTDDL